MSHQLALSAVAISFILSTSIARASSSEANTTALLGVPQRAVASGNQEQENKSRNTNKEEEETRELPHATGHLEDR